MLLRHRARDADRDVRRAGAHTRSARAACATWSRRGLARGSAKPLTCLAGGAGCKAPLPHKAVAQALASPVRRQRDAIVARAELMRANIEGLQSCPFCPYGCVKPALFTDAPEVFQCEHPDVRQAVLHAVQGRNITK